MKDRILRWLFREWIKKEVDAEVRVRVMNYYRRKGYQICDVCKKVMWNNENPEPEPELIDGSKIATPELKVEAKGMTSNMVSGIGQDTTTTGAVEVGCTACYTDFTTVGRRGLCKSFKDGQDIWGGGL